MVAEWQAALAKLRGRIGEDSCRAWIDDVECRRDEKGFRLEVGTAFGKEWLARHFLHDIRAVLGEVVGGTPEVRLVVVERAEKPIPDSGPARRPAGRKRPAGAARSLRIGHLVEHYTFEKFVVGPSNELAVRACRAVAETTSRAFNPLFLWGGVGLGKTHLISAIAHRYLAGVGRRRIAFLSAEEFMNQMIGALREDRMNAFRDRFRELDLLIVDDVEFLAGKKRTQEEFFHTFDALFSAGKQVVLTSDKPPQEIPQLAQRLRSRFEGGLNADVRPPSPETRLEIVWRKAEDQGARLTDPVARMIVERSGPSVRELEGALTRVLAWAELRDMPLDENSVRSLLAPVARPPGRVHLRQVLEATSKYFRIPVDELRSHTRERSLSEARQIAMFLCRTVCEAPYSAIAADFNGRDHSTVVYAVRTVERRRGKDARLDVTIQALERTLREAADQRVA